MRTIAVLMLFAVLTACSSAVTVPPPSPVEKTALREIDRAKRATASGDTKKALEYLDAALDRARSANLPQVKIRALIERAVILTAEGDHARAAIALKEAREASAAEAPGFMPFIVYSEAVMLRERGDGPAALAALNSIASVPDELQPAVAHLKALIELGRGQFGPARDYAGQALGRATDLRYFDEQAAALRIIAWLDASQGKVTDAVAKAREALEIDRRRGNLRGIYWGLEFLGVQYERLNDREKAFYCYYEGYEAAAAAGDMRRRAFFLEKSSDQLKNDK